jgi:phage shock protein A
MTGTFRPEMPLPSPAIFSHNIVHTLTSVSVSGVTKMGIFSRTRDIIAANVTDLLDKADDPAKMIRMIILEMARQARRKLDREGRAGAVKGS